MKALICSLFIVASASPASFAYTLTTEEKSVNPHLQRMVASCPQVNFAELSDRFDKTQITRNGRRMLFFSVKYKWVAVPGTFGELGGEQEVSSRLEYIVKINGDGSCVAQAATHGDRLTPRNVVDLSLADHQLFQCQAMLNDLSGHGLVVVDMLGQMVKEGKETPINEQTAESTKVNRVQYIYPVVDAQGSERGRLISSVTKNFTYTHMSHVDVEIDTVNNGCKLIK